MSDVKKDLIEEETTTLKQNAENVPESKKGFLMWVKAHKKQLILAGVSITTIVGIILGIKNKDAIEELWTSLAKTVKKVPTSATTSMPVSTVPVTVPEVDLQIRPYTHPTEVFDVSRHVRTMAAGKHHSAAKAAEAAALGIDLLPNQTLVGPYTKCAA